MAHFLIANVKVNDDSWIPEYAANVHDIVHKHGGKYLARSGNITLIEGAHPGTDVIAIIEFPEMDKLQAFMNDPDYKRFADARQAGTESVFVAIDSTDVAGAIPYLDTQTAE